MYLPDWRDERRLEYSNRLARTLAALLPPGMLLAGELMLVWPRPWNYERLPLLRAALGVGLGALIIYYSRHHKQDPFSPLVMAACRGLVYLIASAWLTDAVPSAVLIGAGLLTLYVIALSRLAKHDMLPGGAIAALIGGISLLDAAMVVAATGRMDLALVTACGFPTTLVLQRLAPGT